MRKVRAKQLRQVARVLYKPERPNVTPRKIYRALKKMWTRGLLVEGHAH